MERQQGQLLQRGPYHVVLSAEPKPLRVAATTIDTLWTRGNSGKTGAIVGAVVLGTLGAVVGAAYAAERNKDDYGTEPDISRGAHACHRRGWTGRGRGTRGPHRARHT